MQEDETIGFDPNVYDYTAETENENDEILVTALPERAVISIELNGEPHENGTSADWEDENIIEITVSMGATSLLYTVLVTKTI